MPIGKNYKTSLPFEVDNSPRTWDNIGDSSKLKPTYSEEAAAKQRYNEYDKQYGPLTVYDECFQNINGKL